MCKPFHVVLQRNGLCVGGILGVHGSSRACRLRNLGALQQEAGAWDTGGVRDENSCASGRQKAFGERRKKKAGAKHWVPEAVSVCHGTAATT